MSPDIPKRRSTTLTYLQNLVAYFLPILHRVPVFGAVAANKWLWAFDLSPAYVGYGIITGTSVNLWMLLGAIIAFGILSPVAKHRGWAPGPVADWDHGARGWVIWVGMGLILGDSAIGLSWTIFKPCLLSGRRSLVTRLSKWSHSQEREERAPLVGSHFIEGETDSRPKSAIDDEWPSSSLATRKLLIWTSVILLCLYFLSFWVAFRAMVTPFATFIAILLVPLAGLISMRSLGETDYGASLAIGMRDAHTSQTLCWARADLIIQAG